MNILLIAFEGEARLMAEISIRLKAQNHSVFVFSCDHFNVTHSNSDVLDYYKSMGLDTSEYGNMYACYDALNAIPENIKTDAVDWEYLKKYEVDHCKINNLNELAQMDTLMSGFNHHRDIYYRSSNKLILYKFIELQAKFIDKIFLEKKINLVLSYNYQYFLKALVYNYAKSIDVDYLTIFGARIKDWYLIYDNFCTSTPVFILEEMERLSHNLDPCCDAKNFVEQMKRDKKPAYLSFESTAKLIRMRLSYAVRLREILSVLIRQSRYNLYLYKHFRGWFKSDYFLPSHLRTIKTYFTALWRRFDYFRNSELLCEPTLDEPYIYFPLHLIPESNTLTSSTTLNEKECIYQLSKKLPVGWRILVKINPNMLANIDTHPTNYYKKIAELPNVYVVHPFASSAELIEKSKGVACLAGTALLEAAIYNKPGIRWGNTEFSAINTIQKFSEDQTFESLLRLTKNNNVMCYIQACYNKKIILNPILTMQPFSIKIQKEKELEYFNQIDSIVSNIKFN